MIGDIIKGLRKEKGITQKTLAAMTGVSESAIKTIETNRNNPSYDLMGKIANALNVDSSVLLGEKEPSDKKINSFTLELLEKLVKENVIEDINDIKEEELNLIISAVKMDLRRIKKGII